MSRNDDRVRLRHMLDAAREACSQLPWADMIVMRNRVVHAYFDVDLDVLWTTVTADLPQLSAELDGILGDEPSRSAE